MRTDYKNINKFEAGVVAAIAAGFVIIGVVLFATLTPRAQASVSSAFSLLDIHSESGSTLENIRFVLETPAQFFEQFYLAFQSLAVMDKSLQDSLTFTTQIFDTAELAFNHLSDQAVRGYGLQIDFQEKNAEAKQLAYNGKVMGAAIKVSEQFANTVVYEQPRITKSKLYYSYKTENYLIISRLVERAKKVTDLR